MNMKHITKIAVLLIAITCSALVRAELLPYPTDTINGQIVYRYRVPKSIGLYRVSVNFGVTQDEIIKWNPQLRERGLHYDEIILVPAKEEVVAEPAAKEEKEVQPVTQPVAQEQPVSQEKHQPQQTEVTTQAETIQPEAPIVADSISADTLAVRDTIPADSVRTDSLRTIKLALLLPLQAELKQREANVDRFVDFYEGCLLALNDLQDSARFELFVYDTGRGENVIKNLIADSVLHGMDAIIGPAYPSQVSPVAQLALMDSIPVLIPFTDRVQGILQNPFLFQFNPDVKGEAKALASYLEANKDSVNCVFVDAREADIPYSIREFRQEIRNRGMSNTRISAHDILNDSIGKALKDSMENIVVFNSEKFSNIQFLLSYALRGKGNRQVTLYSRYSWQKEQIILPQIYTSVFVTPNDSAVAHYETQYALHFKHEHASDQPRFDLLGYDITRKLVAYLTNTEDEGLQSRIRFEPVEEGGGSINRQVEVIRK